MSHVKAGGTAKNVKDSPGQRLGVKVRLTQKSHGLQRDVEAYVSGKNVDQFIGEFARLG